MHTMNKNTVKGYRDELTHTVYLVQEMFNSHVVNSFYATSEVNNKLSNALIEAEKVLMNVYQIIDESNEQF